ncbi:hypothetical protein CEXT_240421 [Caerostris extrusa]|uniref:Uncharacterized protein n=1 Tax=Caerostris extrusa TaxID=172846 RepID=A0AAV4XME9_CAEEX|nr:hypothetical protein CEXT_240421 [Caerostris extrusa]
MKVSRDGRFQSVWNWRRFVCDTVGNIKEHLLFLRKIKEMFITTTKGIWIWLSLPKHCCWERYHCHCHDRNARDSNLTSPKSKEVLNQITDDWFGFTFHVHGAILVYSTANSTNIHVTLWKKPDLKPRGSKQRNNNNIVAEDA